MQAPDDSPRPRRSRPPGPSRAGQRTQTEPGSTGTGNGQEAPAGEPSDGTRRRVVRAEGQPPARQHRRSPAEEGGAPAPEVRRVPRAGQAVPSPSPRETRPDPSTRPDPGTRPDPSTGAVSSPPPTKPVPAGRTVRRLAWAIGALLVLGIGGFLIDGANRPANPHLVPAYDPTAPRGSVPLGTATLSVKPGSRAPACVLEAVTAEQQAQGLMNRTSVAPYAGMAFVFASPTEESFYMKDTLIPLSIAWFNAAGRFEAETLMPPCPQTAKTCPTYGPGEPYTLAVEVPAGQLPSLGIGPGSTAQLGGACT